MIRLPLVACLMAATVFGACSSNRVFQPPYCPQREPEPALSSPGPSASGPLHRAALDYDRFFQDKLKPNPHGGLVNVIFEKHSTTNPQSYDDQQDSAIWTGTYLAAEAFRYASTQDPEEKREALENARGAAATLDLFLKVTGENKLLARFAGPLDQTSLYLHDWQPGKCQGVKTVDQAGKCCKESDCFQSETDGSLFWLGGTSRDQYTGWFFGMGIAYRLIDHPDLRQMIRDDMRTLITALKHENWIIRAPDEGITSGLVEPMEQLTWLLIAADVLGAEGCAWYEERVREVWPVLGSSIENDFNVTNLYMQYYGFNLAFLNFYNLIHLEPNPNRRQFYLDSLMKHTYKYVEGTENVFFDYITQAVGGTVPAGTLDQDRDALSYFLPGPAPTSLVVPPQSKLSKVSIDLHHLDKKIQPQAEAPYPLAQRCQQDFMWQQTPYAICCFPIPSGQTSWIPSEYQAICNGLNPFSTTTHTYFPRADFLVAYWMGRYHGFLSAKD